MLSDFILILLAYGGMYCSAMPSYKNLIPNGKNVPNPCGGSYSWDAVGHVQRSNGVTGFNQFGIDFQAAGRQWTRALCQKDSDGDGKTNGEELGDPQCVWTRGAVPTRTTDISHPGICEPVTSQTCRQKNSFLAPSYCPALDRKQTPQATAATRNSWQLARGCTCYCFSGTQPSRYESSGRNQQEGRYQAIQSSSSDELQSPLPQMPIPDPQVPEFNNNGRYKVTYPCSCACPKSSNKKKSSNH